jgi:shikimate kinase
MGAGKSTVGPKVAALTGWPFKDMDSWIEQRTGLPVAEIFRQRGESDFRSQETQLAEEIARIPQLVVAAGGGAFTFPRTRQALQNGAFTVWLRCELDEILSRVQLDGSRPLAPDRETIVRLYSDRQPSYRLADWVVDTTAVAPDDVARAVVDAFRTRQG